jgi:hypothetical protein
MKRLALLLITMCIATVTFAQTPAPKLETWKIDDQFSVQYDPTLWRLEMQPENHDKTPHLYPLYKDEKGETVTRKDAMIVVHVIANPEHTFEETVKHAVKGISAKPNAVPMELSEFFAGSNRGVFFAWIQGFDDDPRTYLINDYAFPGTTDDVKSTTTVLFEAMFPADEGAKEMLDRSDAVIKTFTITEAPKNAPTIPNGK